MSGNLEKAKKQTLVVKELCNNTIIAFSQGDPEAKNEAISRGLW